MPDNPETTNMEWFTDGQPRGYITPQPIRDIIASVNDPAVSDRWFRNAVSIYASVDAAILLGTLNPSITDAEFRERLRTALTYGDSA